VDDEQGEEEEGEDADAERRREKDGGVPGTMRRSSAYRSAIPRLVWLWLWLWLLLLWWCARAGEWCMPRPRLRLACRLALVEAISWRARCVCRERETGVLGGELTALPDCRLGVRGS
jgi:hypothetical protein